MSIQVRAVMVNKVPLFAYKAPASWSDKCSKILGASFEPQTGVWYHPAYYPFGLLVKKDLDLVFHQHVSYEESAVKHVNMLTRTSKDIVDRKLRTGFVFHTTPMDHQIEGLCHAVNFHRLGLFWDCGVGKTKVAIDAIRYLGLNTLFVCPTRLVRNFEDEVAIHAKPGDIEVVAITDRLTKNKKIDRLKYAISTPSQKGVPRVVVVGYETASHGNAEFSYESLISKIPYDMFIADESHKLRSLESNTSVTCSKLASKAVRRIIMTGTPSLGNPMHLYVQMRLLLPWRFGNYFKFKAQHVITAKSNPKIVIGYKNLHLIRSMVGEFAIQKTKEECMDLPERQVVLRKIWMSSEQQKMYDEIRMGIHNTVEYNPTVLLKIMKLHQLCGGTLVHSPIDNTACDKCENLPICVERKIGVFTSRCVRKDERVTENIILDNNPKLDYLEDMLDSLVICEQKKVILWYSYQNEYTIITKLLKDMKIAYVDYAISGHDGVHKFQSEDKPMVFLSQIQSSSGITLTEASYTIYYSCSFNLEHYLQSRDRMYRKGQIKRTTEFHLMMVNSLDEMIYKYLEQKVDINDALLRQDFQKEIISTIILDRKDTSAYHLPNPDEELNGKQQYRTKN